jgi:RNA polymerase sigma-70 factor (ECF subfamily)
MESLAARQEGFRAQVEEHAGIVGRVVRTYCRDRDDQMDLAQEIRVQLWLAFPKYDPARQFSTWMYRIALNTAISWVRKAEVRSRPVAGAETRPPPEEEEHVRVLHQLVDGLDQMNRALLLLYMDELSYADIGEVLGITSANVATRISRVKQQLRDQINSKENNDGT